MRLSNILLPVIAALSLSSCLNKEHFDLDKLNEASWNPHMALPVVKSKLGVQQLMGVTDSNAVDLSGSVVTLKYGGQTLSLDSDQLIQLEDVNTPENNIAYAPVSSGPIEFPLYDGNNANIDEIIFSAGNLVIETSGASTPAQLTFRFPDLLNQQGQSTTIVVQAGSNVTQTLANHALRLNGGKIRCSVEGDNTGTCKLAFKLTGADYISVKGDFGFETFRTGQDSFQLHLFKNVGAKGDIELDDPRLILTVDNGFGIPFELVLDQVSTLNTATGQVTPLNANSNQITPIKPASANGTAQTSIIRIDKTNSELANFIEPTPKYARYNLGLKTGSTPAPPHILHKGAKCDLKVDMELPLIGKIRNFEIIDTVPFKIDQTLNHIDDITFKSYTKNGFPLDVTIELTLLDEQKNLKLKTDGSSMVLLNEILTAAALVNSDGEVSAPMEVSSEHKVIDKEVLDALTSSKYVKVHAKLNTTNNGNSTVKILSDYEIDLRLGVKITGNIKIN